MDINVKLAELAQEIIDEETDKIYSDFIQTKLNEFYLQDYAANSHDNDSEFYGEVV